MIPKHAQELLNEIDKIGYKPKGKEISFIKDVKDYIDRNMRLTDPMTRWLNDIYRKASDGGCYQGKQYL